MNNPFIGLALFLVMTAALLPAAKATEAVTHHAAMDDYITGVTDPDACGVIYVIDDTDGVNRLWIHVDAGGMIETREQWAYDAALYMTASDPTAEILRSWVGVDSVLIERSNPVGDISLWVGANMNCSSAIPFALHVEKAIEDANIRGTVKDPAGAVMPNSTVTLWSANCHVLASKKTDAKGVFSFQVRAGTYKLQASSPDGSVSTWYGGTPAPKADEISVGVGKSTSRNFVLGVPPILEAVTPNPGEGPMVAGTVYDIDGSQFGTKKGYLDFNGYLTNSSTVILLWTNTHIQFKAPAAAATSGCFKIFTPAGGYSDCMKPVQ